VIPSRFSKSRSILEVAVILGERNSKPLIQDLTPSPSFLFLAFTLGFVSMCGSEEASEIQREDMHSDTRREEN